MKTLNEEIKEGFAIEIPKDKKDFKCLYRTKENTKFKKLNEEERLIILEAKLDSECYILGPDCSKCTHALYENGSKNCMYNLKTEECYKHGKIPRPYSDESLGPPEKWEIQSIILTIYYNNLYRGKLGRTLFTNKKEAINMMDMLNSGNIQIGFVNTKTKDSYINVNYKKLEEQGLLVKLPCKISENFYVIEAKCTNCEYKKDVYRDCRYNTNPEKSLYTCNYYNEIGMCYIFNLCNGEIFNIIPKEYYIKEICMLNENIYDLYRNTVNQGISSNKEKLVGKLREMNSKSYNET